MKLASILILFTVLCRNRSINSFKYSPRKCNKMIRGRIIGLKMHFGHDHSHSHSHNHDDDKDESDHVLIQINNKYIGPASSWGQLAYRATSPVARIFVVALFFVIPAIFRRKLTKYDVGAFGTVGVLLSCFQSAKKGTVLFLWRYLFGFCNKCLFSYLYHFKRIQKAYCKSTSISVKSS